VAESPERPLRRHATDGLSLVLGLLLVSVAALFLVNDLTDGIDLQWAAPAALILVGLAGLAGSARRR
jgi:hypothetical protein